MESAAHLSLRSSNWAFRKGMIVRRLAIAMVILLTGCGTPAGGGGGGGRNNNEAPAGLTAPQYSFVPDIYIGSTECQGGATVVRAGTGIEDTFTDTWTYAETLVVRESGQLETRDGRIFEPGLILQFGAGDYALTHTVVSMDAVDDTVLFSTDAVADYPVIGWEDLRPVGGCTVVVQQETGSELVYGTMCGLQDYDSSVGSVTVSWACEGTLLGTSD